MYLEEIDDRLAPVSPTARLDAQVLLAHVLGRPRSWVLAHPEAGLNNEQRRALEGALQRLEGGEPLPYVLGHWEFFGLDFLVTPATLIPRPETELLVERALGWLKRRPERRTLALDVGTGSGCIAVSLAVNCPELRLLASDVSMEALKVAGQNVRRHGVERQVQLLACELTPAIGQRAHLLGANLPYIPTGKLGGLPAPASPGPAPASPGPAIGREPSLALDGGRDGLDLIGRLLEQAPGVMAPGGLILLEIEATQGLKVLQLAQSAFPAARVQILPDLAGYDRLAAIELP